jgi:hypothetical protein
VAADSTAFEPTDRLNGWKEIATFLGKGVRTVQRWEHKYKLPVYRLGTDGSEIVFAFKSEITQWSVQRHHSTAPVESKDSQEQVFPSEPPQHLPSGLEDRRVTPRVHPAVVTPAWMTAIAALVIGVISVWILRDPALGETSRVPASWRVDGDVLRVMNHAGDMLWNHPIGTVLAPNSYGHHERQRSVLIEDLNDDGHMEVLFGVHALDRAGAKGIPACTSHRYWLNWTKTAPCDRAIGAMDMSRA